MGCGKSVRKPKVSQLLEWRRANKTEIMKTRILEEWQGMVIVPGMAGG